MELFLQLSNVTGGALLIYKYRIAHLYKYHIFIPEDSIVATTNTLRSIELHLGQYRNTVYFAQALSG